MAKSRFEYVRSYETSDALLPNTFLIVRIDGHAFHKFSDDHTFSKPNDSRALDLMDKAATCVLEAMPDVIMAFGESDEYSFLIRRASNMYNRRESKIVTLLVSLFSSAYVYHWNTFLPSLPLKYPPSFDGRVVQYPGAKEIRDYFSWRQADTHINNLYNTTFWALVQQGGQSTTQAHKTLQGSFSSDKNEILFKQFGLNYSTLPARFRKGSIVMREALNEPGPVTSGPSTDAGEQTEVDHPEVQSAAPSEADPRREKKQRKRKELAPYDGTSGQITTIHEDIIKDDFWEKRPWLLL